MAPTDDYISNRIFLSIGIGAQAMRNGRYAKWSGASIAIALLAIYALVLGIGLLAEIWHIEWILNLPLYKL